MLIFFCTQFLLKMIPIISSDKGLTAKSFTIHKSLYQVIYNHKSIESTGPVEKLGSEMLALKRCKCTFIWNLEKKDNSGDLSCISDRLILYNIVT